MKRNIMILITVIASAFQLQAQTLSLDSCKHYALEHNKQIKASRLSIHAAEELKKNVYTNFFPKVNAQAAMMKTTENLIDTKTPETDLPVYDGNPDNLESATQYAYVPSMEIKALDYLNVGMVTATEPVYAGGKIRTGYELAGLSKDVSEQELVLSTEDVIVKTEEYYWNLVSLNAKRRTLASYEKMLNSLLSDVSVSYEAGLTQKSDLLKVKMQLNQVEADKLKLENGITLTEMSLCQHIGIEYQGHLTLQDTTFSMIPPQMLYRQPDSIISKRAEYKLLNKAVDAEVLQQRLTRADYLPQLAVGVAGQYLDVVDQDNTFGIAFATLSIPISDWWGGAHKLKEHEIRIDIAKTNREDKAEMLRLQIARSYQQLTESYQQIGVAESSVQQADEHLSVVTDNWKAGIMPTSDLLEAQAMYQKARDNLVDTKSTYQISQTHYKQAVVQLQY